MSDTRGGTRNLKLVIAGLLASILCTLFAATAQADPVGVKVGNSLLVERIDQINVSEFWKLAKQPSLYSDKGNPPGGALGLWLHDYEQAPREGDWVAVGLIGVGFGDLGETPIMIRVWAKSPTGIMGAKLAVVEVRAKSDQAMAFDVGFRGQHFMLTTTPEGLVHLDDSEIGSIE